MPWMAIFFFFFMLSEYSSVHDKSPALGGAGLYRFLFYLILLPVQDSASLLIASKVIKVKAKVITAKIHIFVSILVQKY